MDVPRFVWELMAFPDSWLSSYFRSCTYDMRYDVRTRVRTREHVDSPTNITCMYTCTPLCTLEWSHLHHRPPWCWQVPIWCVEYSSRECNSIRVPLEYVLINVVPVKHVSSMLPGPGQNSSIVIDNTYSSTVYVHV